MTWTNCAAADPLLVEPWLGHMTLALEPTGNELALASRDVNDGLVLGIAAARGGAAGFRTLARIEGSWPHILDYHGDRCFTFAPAPARSMAVTFMDCAWLVDRAAGSFSGVPVRRWGQAQKCAFSPSGRYVTVHDGLATPARPASGHVFDSGSATLLMTFERLTAGLPVWCSDECAIAVHEGPTAGTITYFTGRPPAPALDVEDLRCVGRPWPLRWGRPPEAAYTALPWAAAAAWWATGGTLGVALGGVVAYVAAVSACRWWLPRERRPLGVAPFGLSFEPRLHLVGSPPAAGRQGAHLPDSSPS